MTEMMTEEDAKFFEDFDEDEVWELQGDNKGCVEERFIKEFLIRNPEIEARRLARLKALNEKYKGVKIVKCQNLIREDGVFGKCLITDKGDKLLVRNLNGKVKISSETISGNW